MRAEILNSILNDLNTVSAEVIASAVISTDGLVMSSVLPQDIDGDRLGAMSAAMLSLGDRAVQELGRGNLEQIIVKGREGYIVLIHAGHEAVLAVMTSQTARLGLIFLEVKRAVAKISNIV
jgi:predicted regulator of Ras-like GTPase activity (Roadblock/LC7/MglB family)